MNSGVGCVVAFISVFYLAGFWLLGHGVWAAWHSTQARKWPTVPGAVTHAAVETHRGSKNTTYDVNVKYTYAVDGVTYAGSRLAFGYVSGSDRERHEKICQKLRGAESVAVRYDPADPSSSVLSVGIHRSIRFRIVFAIVWLALVFAVTYAMWAASRHEDELLENLIVQ
jgi:hypothetical protein